MSSSNNMSSLRKQHTLWGTRTRCSLHFHNKKNMAEVIKNIKKTKKVVMYKFRQSQNLSYFVC